MYKHFDNEVLIQVWHTANQLETDDDFLFRLSEELQSRGLWGKKGSYEPDNALTDAEILTPCDHM